MTAALVAGCAAEPTERGDDSSADDEFADLYDQLNTLYGDEKADIFSDLG